MANAKIVAAKEITTLRKASSKTLYQSKTKDAVDTAITEAASKTATITGTLTAALDAGIAKGKTLPGKMPKQPFNAKNAIEYLTSPEFMQVAKKMVLADVTKPANEAMESFNRRKQQVYKEVKAQEVKVELAAAR
jgi:hypothetical protein